jgi:hypothetical protein
MVSGDEAALGEEVSTVGLAPLVANQLHDVGSILRKLPVNGTITHLMPNVVHAIQLEPAAMILLSEHKRVDMEPVEFILVGVLGVDGFAEDAVHDVISGKEVVCGSAKSSSGDVEVAHLVLWHWLGVEMNLEGMTVVVKKLIANPMCKLCPSGPHDMLLGHSSERVITILINLKHHGGVELANDLLVVGVVEGHQRD